MQRKKRKLYNCIIYYLLGFLYVFSQYYPTFFRDTALGKTVFEGIFALCTVIALFIMCVFKTPITTYDWVSAGVCLAIAASGFHNNLVLYESIRTAYRIFSFWAFFKMVFTQPGKYRKALIIGMADYMVLICAISTIHIVMNGGQEFGKIFLLGSDNGIANIYFFACLIAYISWYYCRHHWGGMLELIVALASTVIYSFMLEVGTAVLWTLTGLSFLIGSLFFDIKRIRLRYLMIAYAIITVLIFSLVQITGFTNIVNALFYGKIDSITSRISMWNYFIGRLSSSPILGFGASADIYGALDEGLQKWHLIGNNHNILLDAAYHHGYLTFGLILVLIILLVVEEEKSENPDTVLGIFFFMLLMHGLLEAGFRYILIYTSVIYYCYHTKYPLVKRKPRQIWQRFSNNNVK